MRALICLSKISRVEPVLFPFYHYANPIFCLRVKIPTPLTLDPSAANLREGIAELPRSGVYALCSPAGPPHLGWSSHLQRRISRLLGVSRAHSETAIAQLRDHLSCIQCWPSGSRLESSLLLYQLSKLHYPGDYLKRIRLRTPWFIGLTAAPFAHLRIVNRLSPRDGPIFGPFPSRDLAQDYQLQIEGLFQIRRCTETLAPVPEHPGCIYGEMNQCLRPCQCAVTADEYGREAARVADFLSTNGKNSLALLSAARDRACEETQFEEAAQIHKRLERLKEAASSRHEVITEVHQFNGVALTYGNEPRKFLLWPMLEGLWQEPIELNFSGEASQSGSLDAELRNRLSASLSSARTEGKRAEDLALFSRWYFSSWRDGEWFPFRTPADLNYRKLVRQISNLAKTDPVKTSPA